MCASARILDQFARSNGSAPMRILGASGQLGYGIPTPAFSAGLDRQPHLIGCDMGSIDIGPYYRDPRQNPRAQSGAAVRLLSEATMYRKQVFEWLATFLNSSNPPAAIWSRMR